MSKITIEKKDFIWNMLGSLIYSLVSMTLSIIITRLTNAEVGGSFSFGYTALAQIVFIISYFGSKSYIITDVQYKYNFSQYYYQRIWTSLISLFFGFNYILIMFFSSIYKNKTHKVIMLFLLVISGMLDGYFDLFECELQRINKLYIAGYGLFFRTLIFVLTLILSLFITGNIVLSLFISILFKIFVGYILEEFKLTRIIGFHFEKQKVFSFNNIKNLTIELFPLFLITFLDVLIHSCQKFAIDLFLTDYHNGLYNILFIPGNGIYLLPYFILRPILTPLSKIYDNDKSEYVKKTTKIIIIAIICCIFMFIFAIMFYRVYFNIINYLTKSIYEKDLFTFRIFVMFTYIIIGSIFYVLNSILFYFFVIEKQLIKLLIIYCIGLFFSFIISYILIYNSFFYSALSYCICMIFIFFLMLIIRKKTILFERRVLLDNNE